MIFEDTYVCHIGDKSNIDIQWKSPECLLKIIQHADRIIPNNEENGGQFGVRKLALKFIYSWSIPYLHHFFIAHINGQYLEHNVNQCLFVF